MKLQVHPVFMLLCYIAGVIFTEMAKEINTIGTANIRKYDRFDWGALAISIGAVVFFQILSFFDSSYHSYKNGKLPILPSEPETKTAKENANEQDSK